MVWRILIYIRSKGLDLILSDFGWRYTIRYCFTSFGDILA